MGLVGSGVGLLFPPPVVPTVPPLLPFPLKSRSKDCCSTFPDLSVDKAKNS
jgi:hypothetical protein